MHVPRIALLLLVLNGPILADETAKTATGSVLHRIEPGRYHRGLSGGERELQRAFPYSVSAQFYGNSESPKHPVWVTKPFFISKTEVTVGEFRKFVEETRYVTTAEKSGTGIVTWAPTSADKPLYQSHDFERKAEANWKNPGFKQGDDHPVVGVSWDDAQAFLRWLSEKDGVKYRLPTEAEWELACRAGAKTWFSFGDVPRDEIHKHANIGNVELEKFRKHSVERQWLLDWENELEDGYVFTAPVGKYEPNVFGLHDMHGNVWEWCQDLYLDTFYKKWDRGGYQDTVKLAIDPLNASEPQTPTNQFRAIRGGGWY
ncbi:MAG: formylglycine-generating enzyme family protein, partial [Verrucomicrobiales bacterium]|nr:formylglycine-generating enzyme family protein [Verrucomicrobiales bacterium]